MFYISSRLFVQVKKSLKISMTIAPLIVCFYVLHCLVFVYLIYDTRGRMLNKLVINESGNWTQTDVPQKSASLVRNPVETSLVLVDHGCLMCFPTLMKDPSVIPFTGLVTWSLHPVLSIRNEFATKSRDRWLLFIGFWRGAKFLGISQKGLSSLRGQSSATDYSPPLMIAPKLSV